MYQPNLPYVVIGKSYFLEYINYKIFNMTVVCDGILYILFPYKK